MGKEPNPRPSDDETVIFTRYITLRNGKRIFASAYGLDAFRIVVKKR